MSINRENLYRVARMELREWRGLDRGIVLAILFCFIHRVTTGERVEDTFFNCGERWDDYQI